MGNYSKLIGSGIGGAVAILLLNVIKFYMPDFSEVVLGTDEAKMAFGTVVGTIFVWAFPTNTPGDGSTTNTLRSVFFALVLAGGAPMALTACMDRGAPTRPLTVEEQQREQRADRLKAVAAAELVWDEVLTQMKALRETGRATQADIDQWAPLIRSVDSSLGVANRYAKGGLSPDGPLAEVNAIIGQLRTEIRRFTQTEGRT